MASPSLSQSPEPDSNLTWKRKYEVLEAQCAVSREFGPKLKGYALQVWVCHRKPN